MPSARRMLIDSIEEIKAQLAVLSKAREALPAGTYDQQLANSTANLQRALASTVTELRQLKKDERQEVKRMSNEDRDTLVLSYLRDMPPESRARARAELDRIDSEERILAQ